MPRIPFTKEGHIPLSDLQEEMNKLFERLWHGGVTTGPLDGQDWAPPVDVLEEPARYVVKAEVPGLDAGDVDVSISGDALTIKGHKPSERSEGQEANYLRAERRFGNFARSVALPASVDPAKVTAACRQGVLEIILPKKEEARPKSIRVELQE